MSGRKFRTVAALFLIICLVFTFSACSKKGGANDPDKDTAVMEPVGDNGLGGPGSNGDGGDTETGESDPASSGEQGQDLSDVSDGGIGDADGSASDGNGDHSDGISQESWEGDYSFSEYAPPDHNMFYSIFIYKEHKDDELYIAEIYIDGFQTMTRLRAKAASERKDRLDLFFDSYLPDNLMDVYDIGDYLLSFERKGSKLLTHWGGIKPMLLDNNATGEYFDKAEYPVLLMSFSMGLDMNESFEVTHLTDEAVTYSYYDYSDGEYPMLKEKTVPFSELLENEDNGTGNFHISIFLYDGYDVRELEATDELISRFRNDPGFRKKLGSMIGKHFGKQLENDVIGVKDIIE